MNSLSNRRARRALAFIAATATAASVGGSFAAISANAVTDTTPPVLTSLATLPSTVDVTGGAGAIGVALHVTDDLSGFASGTVTASCTSGCGAVTVLTGSNPTFSAGAPTDEQVDFALTVPQSVPDGSSWTVDTVLLSDAAGNSVSYAAAPTGADVAFPGAAPTFTVTQIADTVAPTVSTVAVIGATPVDVTTADKSVGFRIHANDAGSGVDESSLTLTLTPSNPGSVEQTITGFSRVSGTIHSGDYESSVASPASFGVQDGGTWTISNIHVADLGAQSADLSNVAWPSVAVSGGNADTAGPQLSAGSPSFAAGITPAAGDDVSLTSVITDDLTGFQSASGTLSFLAGPPPGATAATSVPFSISTDDLTTGNTYVSTVHMPTNIAPGTYTLTDISLFDRAGNLTSFVSGDPGLPSLGVTVKAGPADAGKPSVASLQTRPATVSIGAGLVAAGGDRSAVAYVTVNDPAADSGFDHGNINVKSPTVGSTAVAVPFDVLNRVSGDAHAGVYRVFLSPQLIDSSADPADGVYTVTSVDVWSTADRDATVASRTATAAQLNALPATTRTFVVAHAAGDTVSPAIQSIEVAPAHIDTSAADQALTVTVHAVDTGTDVSGIRSIDVSFASLISTATVSGGTFGGLNGSFTGQDSLQSGDDTDGTYVFTVPVPRWSTPSDWTLDSASISDNEDNFWNYQRNLPLPAPVNTDDVSVIGGVSHGFTNDALASDTSAPAVTAITLTDPTPVSATDGAPYRVHGTIELTDAEAGVRDVEVDLNGSTGQVALGSMQVTDAGPAADVILPWSALLPKNAVTGDWTISVFAEDRAGNGATLVGAFASGVPTSVAVNGIPDTTPPSLTDITVPTSVDVSAGSADAVLTLHVTDDLSGMADFDTADLVSQTGNATVTYGRAGSTLGDQVVDAHVVGGNATDTMLQADIPFSQFGQAGDWVVKSVNLTDAVANTSGAIDTSSNVITVIGAADTQAPTLTAVALSPDTLNLDAAAAQVTVNAQLTDDVSGVASAVVTLTGPVGQHVSANLNPGASPNVWTGVATVPQFSGGGAWTLTDVSTADIAGNQHDYLPAELAGMVTPATLAFTGSKDTLAPVLAGMQLAPTSVAINGADQIVTATLHVVDDKSGLAFGMLTLTSPSGQSASNFFDPTSRTDGGTGPDGTYSTQLIVPANAEVGSWTVGDVYLEDAVGNSVDLLSDSYPSGAVSTVNVTNTHPPVIDGVINGVVRTAAAAPVVGAPVTACPQNGGSCSTVKTVAGGSYSIGHLRDDSYHLYATAPQGSVLNTGDVTLPSSLYTFASHTATQNFTLTAPVAMPTGISLNGQSSTAGAPVIPRVMFTTPIDVTAAPANCQNGTGSITVTMADGTVLNETASLTSGDLTESPAGSGHFTVSLPAAAPTHGTATVSLAFICGGTARAPIEFTLYIDPSGMVKDVNSGSGIAGANVTLMRSSTATGTYSPVADGSDVMSPSNRHNPDATDGSGHYGWDVTPGYYKVGAQATDCYAPGSYNSAANAVQPLVLSRSQQIPPAVNSLDLLLECTNIAPVASFTQPASASAGTAAVLDASASKDANGTVSSYSWNFGDGTTGTGATAHHSYLAAGNFTPTLTVTDDQGVTSLVKTGAPITVSSKPGSVTGVTATSRLRSVDLTWIAPPSNNSPVTGYTVDVSPGGQHLTTTNTHLTVTGLTGNTTYTFTIVAVNGQGNSPAAIIQAVAGGSANGPTVSITSKPAGLTNATVGSVGFTTAIQPSATLASVTCSVDGGAATSCTSPMALSGLGNGSHSVLVTATDSDGNQGSASAQWVVDTVAATVAMAAPASTTSLVKSFAVRWAGADGNGVSSYDVRYTRATWKSKFGAAATWKSVTTALSATFTGVPGYEYCFSARAHDKAGNVSGWSAAKCSAIPLDDRAFAASTGWKKLTGKAFLNGTVMQTAAKGKALTMKGATAGRAVLYVDKGKGFGTINVLYNGKVVKKISLASTKALTKVAIALPKVTKTTTIVIKTTSAKKVQIDGLLLARI